MTTDKLAVLLDVDGTLVDSNYLHVHAWSLALESVGKPAPAWQIHHSIGMDSGQLLERLLGADADRLGEDAKQVHEQEFMQLTGRLRPFARSADLLRELSGRGWDTVLASSAPEEELSLLRSALDCEDAITAATSSADVTQAKPSPDVVQVAMDKVAAGPGGAIVVGDAVWDVHASIRAGLNCIGVQCGGIGAGELSDAGAVAVYRDPADLLEHLDDSPIGALARSLGRATSGE